MVYPRMLYGRVNVPSLLSATVSGNQFRFNDYWSLRSGSRGEEQA